MKTRKPFRHDFGRKIRGGDMKMKKARNSAAELESMISGGGIYG